jgi:hypothetical protein
MNGFFRISAALTFLPTLALPGPAETPTAQGSRPTLKITMLVYNMANVPAVILDRAEQQASGIYRQNGIELEWKQCPCDLALGPTDVMLRIIPRLFASNSAGFRSDHLGFAASSQQRGVLATIFYNRVEDLTRGGDPSCILGHAIAHELGHLLLGQDAHSTTGLMQAHWTRDDLKLAARGCLQFTSEQAERLRAGVAARSRQREAVRASGPESPN